VLTEDYNQPHLDTELTIQSVVLRQYSVCLNTVELKYHKLD